MLDEAGDLQYEAFLELKALWNATERCCAWYMMGADGLKEKINRAIEGKKVGYTEMLSRYGDTYSKVTPDDAKEREKFLKAQAAIVAKVNAPEGSDIARIVNATGGGLRRVYTEIKKNEEGTSMMTKIEMDAMNAVIGIHRELKRMNEPDWERRRYEIAKEVFSRSWADSVLTDEYMAEKAVAAADALVAELKKGAKP